ncbi:MAG: ABC transporter ATP-binding protein [Chloroflexi bacterium]|nr:ABC transporter ATP-binding protein [Chloroflexota bacterium]
MSVDNPEHKIWLEGVSKVLYTNGRPLPVLERVDFFAQDGEFVSIIGPSGCGKSTLLNIIAGLEEPDGGAIRFGGHDAPSRLGLAGYMHQKDLLLPWRTVLDNAILGLEVQGVPRSEAHRRARLLMGRFGLTGFESEYPYALSGGMRQRAAFLRTVLAEKDLLLLDEPFGALDALTRVHMQEWLLDLWESLKKTIVLVTHDVDEAVLLSDRVYVLTARPGRVKLVQRVDLPRPRRYDMVTWGEFVALKATLVRSLREESHPDRGAEAHIPGARELRHGSTEVPQ